MLEILELSPDHRQLLEKVLDRHIVTQQLQVTEEQLYRLISEGRYLTFREIEGVLQVIDGIIERLENQKGQIAKQERSALQAVKKPLVSKTIRVCGGAALIGVDLPALNWSSVIGGALLILTASLNDK